MKIETYEPNDLEWITQVDPGENDHQAALLHDALRVAAGLPPLLPPVDLFKQERLCRLCA